MKTQELTGISDELSPSSTTVWERPVWKAFIKDRVFLLHHVGDVCAIASIDLLCQTLYWNQVRYGLFVDLERYYGQTLQQTEWAGFHKTSFHENHAGGHTAYNFVQTVWTGLKLRMLHHFAENACHWYGAVVNSPFWSWEWHMPWTNHEGPDLCLVISRRVLRETGQWVRWSPVLMPCLDSGCRTVLWCQTQISWFLAWAGTCCLVNVVLSGYQSCHYPCHSVRPGWQAYLMIGSF